MSRRPVTASWAMWAVHQVVAMNRSLVADLERGLPSRPKATSNRSKRPVRPLYDSTCRCHERGRGGVWSTVTSRTRRPRSASRRARFSLADVTAEEVLRSIVGTSRLTRSGASARMSSSRGSIFSNSVRAPRGWVTGDAARWALSGGTSALPPSASVAGRRFPATSDTAGRQARPRTSAASPVERLGPSDELPRPSQAQPGHGHERAVGDGAAVSPLGASMRSSAHRNVARAPSRTGGSGRHPRSTCCAMPQPWPSVAAASFLQPVETVPGRCPVRVRARMAERGVGVLDVVVERAIDVGDPPACQGHQGHPVVVVGEPVSRRKWQGQLQQVASEQRGGAGDRVGDQERGHVRVVVAPSATNRCRRAADHRDPRCGCR